jgi:hypothetical protein
MRGTQSPGGPGPRLTSLLMLRQRAEVGLPDPLRAFSAATFLPSDTHRNRAKVLTSAKNLWNGRISLAASLGVAQELTS